MRDTSAHDKISRIYSQKNQGLTYSSIPQISIERMLKVDTTWRICRRPKSYHWLLVARLIFGKLLERTFSRLSAASLTSERTALMHMHDSCLSQGSKSI